MFSYQQIYSSYNHKYGEGGKKAQYSVADIGKFHISRIGYFLPDFNGKGNYYYYGKYIEKRDHHNMTRIAEPFKYRMYQENHQDSHDAHNNEVKLLVGKDILALVVYCKYRIMYPRY